MTTEDLDGVVRVARSAFPDHFETLECFAERYELFPSGCFVLADEFTVGGYLIGYPWPLGAIPPLNSLLGGLPLAPDAWYLHDLALHPSMRGLGYARPIVDLLAVRARSAAATVIALVSVNDTRAFWRRMGFAEVAASGEVARKLESYGDGSAYMIREL